MANLPSNERESQFVLRLKEKISELHAEAAAARALAMSFTDPKAVADLENYASRLEASAAELESCPGPFGVAMLQPDQKARLSANQ